MNFLIVQIAFLTQSVGAIKNLERHAFNAKTAPEFQRPPSTSCCDIAGQKIRSQIEANLNSIRWTVSTLSGKLVDAKIEDLKREFSKLARTIFDMSENINALPLPSDELKLTKKDMIGKKVLIKGLQSQKEINGLEGVVKDWDQSLGRWQLEVDRSGQTNTYKVKEDNVEFIDRGILGSELMAPPDPVPQAPAVTWRGQQPKKWRTVLKTARLDSEQTLAFKPKLDPGASDCLSTPSLQEAEADAKSYYAVAVWREKADFEGAVITKLGNHVLLFWHNSVYSNGYEMCDWRTLGIDNRFGVPQLKINVGRNTWTFSNAESVLFGIKEKLCHTEQRSLAEIWSYHELRDAEASKQRVSKVSVERAAAGPVWSNFDFVLLVGASVCTVKFGQDPKMLEMLLKAHRHKALAFQATPDDSLWGVAASGLEMLYALSTETIENIAWWALHYDDDSKVQPSPDGRTAAVDSVSNDTISPKERKHMNGLGKAIMLAGMVLGDPNNHGIDWAKKDLREVMHMVFAKFLSKAPKQKNRILPMFAALRLLLDNVIEKRPFESLDGVTSDRDSTEVSDFVQTWKITGEVAIPEVAPANKKSWVYPPETRLEEPMYCGRSHEVKLNISTLSGTSARERLKMLKARLASVIPSTFVDSLREALDEDTWTEFDRLLYEARKNTIRQDLARIRVYDIIAEKLKSKGGNAEVKKDANQVWMKSVFDAIERGADDFVEQQLRTSPKGIPKDFAKKMRKIWIGK